ELAPVNDRKAVVTVTVVGTWAPRDVEDSLWAFDRLRGDTHRPNVEVPFTGGLITTDGYGPLYTSFGGIDAVPLNKVTAEYLPDFSRSSTADLTAVIDNTGLAERTAQRIIAGEA